MVEIKSAKKFLREEGSSSFAMKRSYVWQIHGLERQQRKIAYNVKIPVHFCCKSDMNFFLFPFYIS